jgi:hypothetical protein
MTELHECEISRLRPTQITVGMIEVHDKSRLLAAMTHRERRRFLKEHPIPAVFGSAGNLYLTDHHHLARALWNDGYPSGFFLVEADLSALAPADFWRRMEEHRWVHPVDADGQRHRVARLPKHVKHLVDDPYRSLAGYVRNAGGYEKTPTAFAEFLWADFFRGTIEIGSGQSGFERAVPQAIALAHSVSARNLPGYLPLNRNIP